MSPQPFYEVKPTHYLFNKQDTPEEKVRQWVLFELLSTYSVHIGNIDVEKPVKVGTRTHRADIVIYKNHIPYVIIECKNQDDTDLEKGLEQAKSYASCLGAKFAVYTNGRDWQVKRFINDSWETVPDLPKYTNDSFTKKLDEFASNYTKIMPILYWIYQPMSIEYRNRVYGLLQDFFMNCAWYCNDSIDSRNFILCQAADDLFRVALKAYEAEYCKEEKKLIIKNNYIDEKSRYSYSEFINYCRKIGFSSAIGNNSEYMVDKNGMSFDTRMIAFSQDLSKLTSQCQNLSNLEANIIKLMNLVMDHLWDEWYNKQETAIPEAVMLQFLKIAVPICEAYFGLTLPEREEKSIWSNFRYACWSFAYDGDQKFPFS